MFERLLFEVYLSDMPLNRLRIQDQNIAFNWLIRIDIIRLILPSFHLFEFDVGQLLLYLFWL